MKEISITSMDKNNGKFAYYLNVIKETSKSFYCESEIYGWIYRIEKATGKVFRDGKQIASTCEYVGC